MSAPVYQGEDDQLTVRKNDSDSAMPPAAAMRVNSPVARPSPTAISAIEKINPNANEWSCTGPSSDPIGLAPRTATSVAWMPVGELPLRNGCRRPWRCRHRGTRTRETPAAASSTQPTCAAAAGGGVRAGRTAAGWLPRAFLVGRACPGPWT